MSIMGSGALSPRDGVSNPAGLAPVPVPYYVWEPPGKAIRILLDFDVVDRMSQDIMRGFGAVPRRGAEVGGILLGTVEAGEKLVVHITGFETVPCQHKRGPSYLLTETDQAAFEESLRHLRQTSQPVGFFRSHTREGLGLTDEDLAFFSRYFPDPTSVILLVRPFATRVSMAGFFFEENGQIRGDQSFLEFPFRRRELGGAVAAPVASPDAASGRPGAAEQLAEPIPAAAPKVAPIRPPNSSGWTLPVAGDLPAAARPEIPYLTEDDDPETLNTVLGLKRSWVWLPLSFLFLMLGIFLGFFVGNWGGRGKTSGGGDLYRLSMTVRKDPNSFHITWDRSSPAIQSATRGIMHITDGLLQKDVELKPDDLKTGSVIYRSGSGNRMLFQLELLLKDGNVLTETYEIPKMTRQEQMREMQSR